jgi:hypothetical protein
MKRSVSGLLVAGFVLAFATALNAGTLEKEGQAWLDAQKEPAAINVSGTWDSERGVLSLGQNTGSRDVNGSGGGYELTGVVSGKRLYLLFSNPVGLLHLGQNNTVDYCAILSSESNNSLTGSYSARQTRLRFGKGLCQEKSKKMYMRKR